MNLGEDLVLVPLPYGVADAVHLVAELSAELAASGGDPVLASNAIADRIIATAPTDSLNRNLRLHRLYAEAYSRDELVKLAAGTLRAAGLG